MKFEEVKPGQLLNTEIEEFGNTYSVWLYIKDKSDKIRAIEFSTGDAYGELFVKENLTVGKDNWNKQWTEYKPYPTQLFFNHIFGHVESVEVSG